MTAQEMIQKYYLTLGTKKDGTDGIVCHAIEKIRRDKVEDEIRARRDEIIAELKAQKAEKEAAYARRQAKIDAIPGLKQILAAQIDMADWKDEFDRQMETESFRMSRPAPQYDMAAMYAEYPQAAAYLKAKAMSLKSNYELAAIGLDALEMVIEGNWQEALDFIKAEDAKFVERHMWD